MCSIQSIPCQLVPVQWDVPHIVPYLLHQTYDQQSLQPYDQEPIINKSLLVITSSCYVLPSIHLLLHLLPMNKMSSALLMILSMWYHSIFYASHQEWVCHHHSNYHYPPPHLIAPRGIVQVRQDNDLIRDRQGEDGNLTEGLQY